MSRLLQRLRYSSPDSMCVVILSSSIPMEFKSLSLLLIGLFKRNRFPVFMPRLRVPLPAPYSRLAAEDLNNRKKDKCNYNLQNSSQSQDISTNQKKETIKELIISICYYQKSYMKNSLGRLLEKTPKKY